MPIGYSLRNSTMKLFYLILTLALVVVPVGHDAGAAEKMLVVDGRAVVFFAPSNSEYLAMTDQEKDAIDEELYDFLHYRNSVLQFLESNEIQEFLTAFPKIEIRLAGAQSLIFTRHDFDHVVGFIMTDGKNEPEVVLGALTRSELIDSFEKYFGLY